jgi:hypothetical protein
VPADEPFFPPPRPQSGYREPGARPTAPVEVEAPRRIVHRPTDAASLERVPEPEAHDAPPPRFYFRRPRVAGFALFVVGALAGWPLVAAITTGVARAARLTPVAPVFATIGLYLLVTGRPRDATPLPRWWKIGFAVTVLAGVLGALALGTIWDLRIVQAPR